MEEVRERIKELVRESGVAANSFGKTVGIDPSNFSRKMRGEQSITRKDIDKISSAIGVSKTWLMDGSGEKYIKEEASAQIGTCAGVPYYDMDFALGFGDLLGEKNPAQVRYISIPGYEAADMWVRTSGDAMSPTINNGDIIALKEVSDWRVFMPMNEIYAVETTNDLRTIKVIRVGKDPEHLTLHSHNEDYEDQEVLKSSIKKVYKVLGRLSIRSL